MVKKYVNSNRSLSSKGVNGVYFVHAHIGYEHFIENHYDAIILKPDSSPVKKIRHSAADRGYLLDATAN